GGGRDVTARTTGVRWTGAALRNRGPVEGEGRCGPGSLFGVRERRGAASTCAHGLVSLAPCKHHPGLRAVGRRPGRARQSHAADAGRARRLDGAPTGPGANREVIVTGSDAPARSHTHVRALRPRRAAQATGPNRRRGAAPCRPTSTRAS